jgi:hypothetical protein
VHEIGLPRSRWTEIAVEFDFEVAGLGAMSGRILRFHFPLFSASPAHEPATGWSRPADCDDVDQTIQKEELPKILVSVSGYRLR